jgi:hypothetical protein
MLSFAKEGSMTRRFWMLFGASVLATAFALAQAGRTIEVNVVYTGAGKVDANHKIYVALWNSPDTESGPPVDVQSVDSKNGTTVFKNVQTVPAYVSVVFDPTGKWDAQSPPPSGSSLGIYSSKPPKLDPIDVAAGKTAKIKVTFNDSQKTP